MTEISRYIWYKLELGLVGPSLSPMNDGIILGFGPFLYFFSFGPKGYKPNWEFDPRLFTKFPHPAQPWISPNQSRAICNDFILLSHIVKQDIENTTS